MLARNGIHSTSFRVSRHNGWLANTTRRHNSHAEETCGPDKPVRPATPREVGDLAGVTASRVQPRFERRRRITPRNQTRRSSQHRCPCRESARHGRAPIRLLADTALRFVSSGREFCGATQPCWRQHGQPCLAGRVGPARPRPGKDGVLEIATPSRVPCSHERHFVDLALHTSHLALR